MSKDRDFDYVIGKLPRKDKEGNDTTEDKIGKGGRHRKDGTYSSVVEDIQIIDDPIEVYNPEPRRKQYEDFSLGEQIIIDVAGIAINRAFDFLTDFALVSFDNWLSSRRRQKTAKRISATQQNPDKKKYTTKAERLLAEMEQEKAAPPVPTRTTIMLPDVDTAYEQFSFNMTSEEAQKELLDAFVLYLISAKKLWKVSHANIIDGNDEISTGQELIDKLSSQPIIDNVNTLLENKPSLLDEWKAVALSDILGRELVVDNSYVPIDDQILRERLLELPEEE